MTLVFVVDTNVVVSGALTGDAAAPTAVILDSMLNGDLPFLLSDALLAEYRSVLLRPHIAKAHGLGASEIDALLADLVANAMIRTPTAAPAAGPDPGDIHIWALAASYPGTVVVTGDQPLLHHPPAGIHAIAPRALVERLKGGRLRGT